MPPTPSEQTMWGGEVLGPKVAWFFIFSSCPSWASGCPELSLDRWEGWVAWPGFLTPFRHQGVWEAALPFLTMKEWQINSPFFCPSPAGPPLVLYLTLLQSSEGSYFSTLPLSSTSSTANGKEPHRTRNEVSLALRGESLNPSLDSTLSSPARLAESSGPRPFTKVTLAGHMI